MSINNVDKYTYRVTWSAADQEHVGLCSEFPSLSWLAPSIGEALEGIRKVVADVVKDMIRNKEEVPEPLATRDYRGNISLRIPPEQHRELAMEAAEQGVSLNCLISKKLGG